MEATKASYTALRAEPWDERRVNSRKLWADLDAKQAVAQTAATKRADEIWESALEVIQKERENKSRKTQSRKEIQVRSRAVVGRAALAGAAVVCLKRDSKPFPAS